MRVGEHGIQLRFATEFDMSSATAIDLVVKQPDGSEVTKIATLGTTPETFNIDGQAKIVQANEWSHYTTLMGEFNQAGLHTPRTEATFSGKKLISVNDTFIIDSV